MRRVGAILRWVPLAIAVAFWFQSATTFPDWLASTARDVSQDDGVWMTRIVLVVCGLVLALVALGPARVSAVKEALSGGPHQPEPRDGLSAPRSVDEQREEVRRAARDELVAAIDDGQALIHPIFGAPYWGPYVIWCRKTVAFLETVFGSHERVRFVDNCDVAPGGVTQSLNDRLGALKNLLEHEERWELRVDVSALRTAALERRARDEGERIAAASSRGESDPSDSRQRERLALADEVEQRAASLTGFCEGWRGRISGHERWPGSPDYSGDRTSAATGEMMREYYEQHLVKTLAVFDRLVEKGVAEAKYRPDIQRPAHPGMVGSIPDLLDNAVARLRISDKALAAWLGQQMEEIRRLQRDLQDEIAPPNFGIGRHTQIDLIQDAFWEINRKVAIRLQRDARPWVDYYTQNPDGFDSHVMRITADQLQEVVKLMGHTVDQLARIREQVS